MKFKGRSEPSVFSLIIVVVLLDSYIAVVFTLEMYQLLCLPLWKSVHCY